MSTSNMKPCTLCQAASASAVTRIREIDYMGHHLRIENDQITHCDSCGEEYYTAEQAKSADRRLVDARRQAERLMSGDEIRSLRQSFALSQQQFESILGIGAKTVVRWENSTAVQSKAVDNVLNMLRYDPLSIVLLSRLRSAPDAVDLQATPEFQRQLGALEQAIYARIEATDVVQQESVKKVTLAVMDAYQAYKEAQIAQLTEEKLASA